MFIMFYFIWGFFCSKLFPEPQINPQLAICLSSMFFLFTYCIYSTFDKSVFSALFYYIGQITSFHCFGHRGFQTWRGWHGKQLLMQCWFSRNKIIYLYFYFHLYQRQFRIKADIPADVLIKACSAYTACLPAASSVGSMHQNCSRRDATFHLQPFGVI